MCLIVEDNWMIENKKVFIMLDEVKQLVIFLEEGDIDFVNVLFDVVIMKEFVELFVEVGKFICQLYDLLNNF